MLTQTLQAQPSGRISLSVVLPAYNEETSIGEVIWEHMRTLMAARHLLSDWEIVCVDDASRDRTAHILEELASQTCRVRIVRHAKNEGISRSFADGFEAARGTHIYATGADGQWPAGNLLRMLAAVRSGAELVVGVRSNRKEVYTLGRRFVSFMFNLLPRALFGVNTVDAGSVKLGAREVFQFPLVSRSPFVEAERILRARRHGFRVDFVPILFTARRGGKACGAKLKNIVSSFLDCLRCLRKYGVHRTNRIEVDTESIDHFARQCVG